jgi:4-amino-4-deoxy-L-arabinose transferase-like glycosyltransferase
MALLRHVFEPQPAGSLAEDLPQQRRQPAARRLANAVAAARRAPEICVLIGLSALLNLWALGRNDWANTYYAAAVRSMAASWHDFLYASLDRSGVMTVDKPPLSLWIQALSVRVFGYHQLAILVPQALMGIASVVLVYDLVRRRFARIGGLVAGLALATTPIMVAMSRDNNPDALLTLCCLAAVWFAVRAFEDGRTRWLVLCGVAVGLGFETKMLVALVVVPAIALGWLWIAPRGRVAAVRQLLTGAAAMVAVAGAWPLLVILTPATDRPWISGTSDNSILSLIFGYNGLGRVTGQSGGPGGLGGGGGGGVFGEGTGALRLLNVALGGQDGWLLGLAVAGALVVAVASRARRRDPRTAWLVVVGGAFVVTAALFSFAHGIFHPYYVVLLAPFTAALAGAGVASLIKGEVPAALAGTVVLVVAVIVEFVVLHDYVGDLSWLRVVLPFLCGGAAGALFVFRTARGRTIAMAIGTAALLIAPAVWAVDTLGYATQATFPAGGPAIYNTAAGGGFGGPGGAGFRHRGFGGGSGFNAASGPGGGGFAGPGGAAPGLFGGGGQEARSIPGFGGGLGGGFGAIGQPSVSALEAAASWVSTHGGGTIAVASQGIAADAIINTHANVAGIGGFTGQESDPSVDWLADEVAAGHIRWVYVGEVGTTGSGVRPGATRVMNAAAAVCMPVTAVSTSLYDCAGKAAALRTLS